MIKIRIFTSRILAQFELHPLQTINSRSTRVKDQLPLHIACHKFNNTPLLLPLPSPTSPLPPLPPSPPPNFLLHCLCLLQIRFIFINHFGFKQVFSPKYQIVSGPLSTKFFISGRILIQKLWKETHSPNIHTSYYTPCHNFCWLILFMDFFYSKPISLVWQFLLY